MRWLKRANGANEDLEAFLIAMATAMTPETRGQLVTKHASGSSPDAPHTSASAQHRKVA